MDVRRLVKVRDGWRLEKSAVEELKREREAEQLQAKQEEEAAAGRAEAEDAAGEGPQAAEAQVAEAEEFAGEANRLRLTDRDRQLMGMLATVRCLSMPQLGRLLFAERNPINLHKRLLALAGEGKHGVARPYLRRLAYRNWEGMPQTAWTLTALGYTVAGAVLPTPPRRPTADVGANFIEHGLMLNELYVQMLEAPVRAALSNARAQAQGASRPSAAFRLAKAGLYARAAHPAFRWHSHDEVRLPWRELTLRKAVNRVIVPDATLELPAPFHRAGKDGQQVRVAGRRYFLEAETGSHTIVAQGDTKPGATLNKVARYAEFLFGYAGNVSHDDTSTWYSRAYPDGFAPTVVFLVASEGRRASIAAALEKWRKETGRHALRVEAWTIPQAAQQLGALIRATEDGAEAPVHGPRTLTSSEFRLVNGWYNAAMQSLKRVRDDARARSVEPPPYPEQTNAMWEVLQKLKGGGR